MKIDVLGTPYILTIVDPKDDEILIDNGLDGYCDSTTKQLIVSSCPDSNLGKKEEYIKRVKRHEIIHAFLEESGLGNSWEHTESGHDETTIDWFAVQFPKLLKAFTEADAL